MSTTSISGKDRVDTILLGRPVNQKPIDALAIRNGGLVENGSEATNGIVVNLPAAGTGEAVFSHKHNSENIEVTLSQTTESTATTETQTVTWRLTAALSGTDREIGVGIRSRPVNQKPIDALILLPQLPEASVNGNVTYESVIRFASNTQERVEIEWTNDSDSKILVTMEWRHVATGGCEGVFQITAVKKNPTIE